MMLPLLHCQYQSEINAILVSAMFGEIKKKKKKSWHYEMAIKNQQALPD